MQRILIVEDEQKTGRYLQQGLVEEGYQADLFNNGRDGLGAASKGQYDLIILDVMLPFLDGWQIISALRESGHEEPVLFLTAKDNVRDKVKGLELGADDYITKPFSLSVLRARVNTQLRKAESLQAHTSASVYRKGCYEFDFERMIFLVDGQEIELSKTEQRLLRLLVQNEGINLRRDFLLDRVWNDSAEFVDANALSVSVKRLRDKLGIPDSIKTVYGIGYRFE